MAVKDKAESNIIELLKKKQQHDAHIVLVIKNYTNHRAKGKENHFRVEVSAHHQSLSYHRSFVYYIFAICASFWVI